jgi:hypothetical protein
MNPPSLLVMFNKQRGIPRLYRGQLRQCQRWKADEKRN